MTPDEERTLIERAKCGDEASFESLVREHQRLVYNLALKLTGNREDALDISQETFFKVYKSLSLFRGECRFSAWVYRLCYNASMDYLRKNARPATASMSAGENGEEHMDIPDNAPLPHERLEREELLESVRAAVMELPEAQRQIILMREFSGMSYEEIADAAGIELGTVKSRLARARMNLAKILKERGTVPDEAPSDKMKGGAGNGRL